MIFDTFGQNHPHWAMLHALVVALAGYTDVFQNVVVGVPGKIGELLDRNWTYVVNSYTRIIGTRFNEKYVKKRFPRVPV